MTKDLSPTLKFSGVMTCITRLYKSYNAKDTNLENHFILLWSTCNTLTSMSFFFLPPLTGSGFPQGNNLLEGYKSVMTYINTLLSHRPIDYFFVKNRDFSLKYRMNNKNLQGTCLNFSFLNKASSFLSLNILQFEVEFWYVSHSLRVCDDTFHAQRKDLKEKLLMTWFFNTVIFVDCNSEVKKFLLIFIIP